LVLQGVPLVLCGSGLPAAIRRAAVLVPAATLPGVPALWRSWFEADSVPANLRLAISAGAPLPLALESAIFERHGTKVHNFYGATECGGIAYDRSEAPRAEAALAGRALEGVALTIGAEGRLEVRSRAVGSTYWPEPDDALSAGVYRTQDLAKLRDGAVILQGRAGDMIHVAGRKVAPEIIERVLQLCPGVRECLVLGMPTDEDVRTETIAVVFVADPTTTVLELQTHARRSLPEWQVPRVWHRVESIEANDRGKLSRRAWRERLSHIRP
jgi:acyl-coenzyme A synthetase/AMP-(fatty) acid ligase